jgi:hypothetical protein
MVTIRETYGIERARTNGRLKKEREAFTTGLLALGISKVTGEKWWVEIETKDNTPDTRLRRLEPSSGKNVIQTRSVEVVDWEENVDDVMEVIRKKCERAYPGESCPRVTRTPGNRFEVRLRVRASQGPDAVHEAGDSGNEHRTPRPRANLLAHP